MRKPGAILLVGIVLVVGANIWFGNNTSRSNLTVVADDTTSPEVFPDEVSTLQDELLTQSDESTPDESDNTLAVFDIEPVRINPPMTTIEPIRIDPPTIILEPTHVEPHPIIVQEPVSFPSPPVTFLPNSQRIPTYTPPPVQRSPFQSTPPPVTYPPLPPTSLTYFGGSTGHWIDEVSGDGRIIVLEDESVWEVHPFDRPISMLWLPITDIVVVESDDPFYSYRLINKDDNETVLARLISQ